MQKILIVSKRTLGNIVLQTGIIQALKDAYPRTQIYLACDQRNAGAVEDHPDIAKVFRLSLKGLRAHSFFSLLREFRKERFDTIVTFGKDSQACLWGFFARIPVRVGIRNQPLGFLLTRSLREHETELNSLEFWHKLTLLFAPQIRLQFPIIEVNKEETAKLRASLFKQKIPKRFIVWHLGASIEEKRYPIFQIIETLRLFKKQRISLPVLFTAGQREHNFILELEVAVNQSNITIPKVFFAESMAYRAMASLFSLADLVICNDSAPRHVAAALKTPSLSLMAKNRKFRWQIYSEAQNAHFLYADSLGESLAIDSIEPIEIARMIREIV